MGFLKQVRSDFKNFWKEQVFWTLIASGIAGWLQYKWGLFAGSVRSNFAAIFLPLPIIMLLSAIFSVNRTWYIRDREALRRKRKAERRAEFRKELAESRAATVAAAPKPNLQCGKVEEVPMDISADGYDVYFPSLEGNKASLLTITNEIPPSDEIAPISDVNAKLSFFSPDSNVALETIETACWTESRPNAHFKVAGNNHLVLFFTERREREPRILDRTHGSIRKKRLPEKLSDILIVLTAPSPAFSKCFHVKLKSDIGPFACKDRSCSFCQSFELLPTK